MGEWGKVNCQHKPTTDIDAEAVGSMDGAPSGDAKGFRIVAFFPISPDEGQAGCLAASSKKMYLQVIFS